LAVNDISPTPEDFAKVNSLSLVFAMAVRTVAPVLASSVYAIGVEGQILRGHLGWAAMFAFALVNLVLMRWFPKTPKKDKAHLDEEDLETASLLEDA
jgi:hypothetical protein